MSPKKTKNKQKREKHSLFKIRILSTLICVIVYSKFENEDGKQKRSRKSDSVYYQHKRRFHGQRGVEAFFEDFGRQENRSRLRGRQVPNWQKLLHQQSHPGLEAQRLQCGPDCEPLHQGKEEM